ncbi:hypothetical protein [Rosistilla oblonga]|uniref:Uncharacterized protein n=1 Tax=Rosistilla oblonga TaxID=2527990 RepID=A0A518J0K7_9BACT|nr:hypothetical protein [Rosistilla oblonga]QDV58869.1 hypothetical protein Mal33_48940 [Rosistilla oblonga]
MTSLTAPRKQRPQFSSLVDSARERIASNWNAQERAQRKAEAERKLASLCQMLLSPQKVA